MSLVCIELELYFLYLEIVFDVVEVNIEFGCVCD